MDSLTVGPDASHRQTLEYPPGDGSTPPSTVPLMFSLTSYSPPPLRSHSPPDSPDVQIFTSPLIPQSPLYDSDIPIEQPQLIQSHSSRSPPYRLDIPPAIPQLLPNTGLRALGREPSLPSDTMEDAHADPWTTRPMSGRAQGLTKSWSTSTVSSAFSSSASSVSSATSSSSPTFSLSPYSPLVMSPHLHPYAQSYASLATSSALTTNPHTAPASSRSRKRSSSAASSASSDSAPASAPLKRRKVWSHALEKSIFSAEELATLGAPVRRTIYTASLEAHIDQMHKHMETLELPSVSEEALNPYTGLNCKTAKSMICGLVRDIAAMQTRLAEIKRAEEIQAIKTEYDRDEHVRAISDLAIAEATNAIAGVRLPARPSEYVYPTFSGADGVDAAAGSGQQDILS